MRIMLSTQTDIGLSEGIGWIICNGESGGLIQVKSRGRRISFKFERVVVSARLYRDIGDLLLTYPHGLHLLLNS